MKVFISYRNTVNNGKFENYDLISDLIAEIKRMNPRCQCITVPPQAFPHGTLFSPYDIADFVYTTFILMDDCDKFYILDKDYFYEDGEMTSIWTEVECCIWSYYSRTGLFNRHKRKDDYYTIASNANDMFSFRRTNLIQLSEYQRFLLRRCVLDFDRTSRIDSSAPYLKKRRKLIVVCDQCKKCFLLSRKEIQKEGKGMYQCACGNIIDFHVEKEHIICSQDKHSHKNKTINIFDAIDLLYQDNLEYPEIQLKQ